ncbi:von Willebrand factor [Triplophysa tibetana]|uniref:von Willebrand factor n=1 Tax=Triplophysa tibetana TaxID=1572043 RepID=A0A5A9NZS7_9TELE|nr:von Willebrand factor [Triplophysa tibetana]
MHSINIKSGGIHGSSARVPVSRGCLRVMYALAEQVNGTVQMERMQHNPVGFYRAFLRLELPDLSDLVHDYALLSWFKDCVAYVCSVGFIFVEGSGRCSLFSRQHVQTFDGVIYEFPGDCSYMLAGDCQHRSFSILDLFFSKRLTLWKYRFMCSLEIKIVTLALLCQKLCQYFQNDKMPSCVCLYQGDFSHGKRKGVTVFLGEVFELHLSVDGTLSQRAERLPLPYASSSVFAGFELGYVQLWSEEFGFSIRIDPSHNIQLTLTKQHSNRTCGLCGNYNYLKEDDFTAQEDDSYNFANSWVMNGAEEPCKRVPPPSQSCNSTGESAKVRNSPSLKTYSDLMSQCEAMSSSGLFLRCAHLIDPAPFVSVCESDVCHCATRDECVCQAMLEYARTCSSRGVTLTNWHVQNQCSPKCPVGMEYSDCTSACSTSCQSLNIQEVCKEQCVDGCNCPGECVVTGQSHYKTFDNKFFTFSGICQYLLAKDCLSNSFSAIIETAQVINLPCTVILLCMFVGMCDEECVFISKCADDQDAICTRSISLRFRDLANQTVRLKHGGVVSVDGMDVQTPLINGALRVQNTVLSSVKLSYGDDLHLDWDGRGRVLLRLSPAYAGKTCGLCGNYNGNQGDDFLTVGGLVETRVEGFGNAWKMNAECENVQLQQSDSCISNPKRVRFAEEACAVMLSVKFAPCHYEVNPEPYVKNCRYDVCSCADGQECLCDAQFECSSVRDVGIECAKTCQNLDVECVSSGCVSGCMCPPGMVRHKKECIPQDQCPCFHNNRPYASGQSINVDCNACVCEERRWKCTQRVCDGVCRAIGETHYISFDGLKFSFPGPCKYVLAQDYCNGLEGTFRVLVENSACGIAGYRCSKSFTVFYMGGLIIMENREVRMKRPVLKETEVEIVRSGQYYIVMLGKHISLTWDTGTRISLQISGHYRGKVCGLCGNFDGSQNNDLMSSSNQMEMNFADFGNSWKVQPSCADAVQVDPEPYWDICTHDTCSCASVGDCACFCNAVAAYAHECSQKGVVVNWRSNDLCRQILDEVLGRCVEPSQCQECMHAGERISHGKQFILNRDDPHLCQICHCESNTMTCIPCPATGFASTLAPTTPTPMPFSTPVPADACDRAMDLAFLVDGSSALSEEDFSLVKLFILRVVERFRMGSAHTRATILLFHSGVKSYNMQVQKWIFKKMVRELNYSDGDVAFMDEAIKYLAVYIYDKNKREHAGRVAILLTASTNPRPMRSTQRLLNKKDITILAVALGPDVSLAQVNEIVKATPSSRAYALSGATELDDQALAITDYLCTLGLDPEPPKIPSTKKTSGTITTTSATLTLAATSKSNVVTVPPTAAILTAFPSILGTGTTLPPSTVTMYEVVFLLESSDTMGEENFNKTRDALVDVITSLDDKEVENLRITVMQYSLTVTVVISRMELLHREQVLLRMRQLRWTRGAEVNTGHAVQSVYESVSTEMPSSSPNQLVFLITQSPPTDVIRRPPSSTSRKMYPIGIGQQIRYEDLAPLSFPDEPIMLDNPSDLKKLRPMLINISRTINRPLVPTLPPRATLPPSVPCTKPMDLLFLLRASSDNQFEDLKTFVKTFVKNTHISQNDTQVAVMVYGAKPAVVISWKDEQNKDNLLKLLDNLHRKADNTSRLGAALRLAVRTAVSSSSGGRMGIPKTVVMMVSDRSIDSVNEAANEALTAGVSVFPIGLGQQYDQTELSVLAGTHAQNNIIRLSSTKYLLAMVALDQSFTDKLCRAGPPGVCVDDEGNERKPGEVWRLADGCHSVLCNPSGTVTLQSHRVNCEKMEPPICKNNLVALRLNHTCGCTWACPCSCSDDQSSLVLSDGSVTADPEVYLKGWALGECVVHQKVESCAAGVAVGCDVLSSEVFSRCHALVPPQDYVQICRSVACQPNAMCDLVSAYSSMCRQLGACVDWRTPTLCPMSCPDSLEYAACRTGCLDQCEQGLFYPGDTVAMGDGVIKANGSQCLTAPTEGCFCPEGLVFMGGKCVSEEACSQCVDLHGRTHKFMESWNPEDNPCLLCVCLDRQRINCTALPCTNAKAPECGQCEVLREKMESKCCPEYECVCDTANCKLPDPPNCADGLSVVLTNPGECLPVYQCVCKKDLCDTLAKPSCPAYKRLAVKQTECCNSYECVCDCQSVTRTCPPGYITKTTANDCDCVEVTCTPDKVCVVDAVVYQVGSRWEEKCKTCTCTEQTDRETGLHIAQCVDPVCNQICPLGYTLQPIPNACCGRCVPTACSIRYSGGLMKMLKANETFTDGCTKHTCSVNKKAELVLETLVTACLPFDRSRCVENGVRSTININTSLTVQHLGPKLLALWISYCVSFSQGQIRQIKDTCCEMCAEPECKRSVGLLNYIRVDDCQSEEKIELTYCEGRCGSKSMYSLDKHKVETECVCCSATGTVPMNVSLHCANGTRTHHQVLAVTGCDCMSHNCPTN